MLDGKVAIVTGSSRGIGAATARLLASKGAKVAINYCSNQSEGESVLKSIQASGGNATLIRADVTCPDQVEQLVSTAEARLGPIDILVNNANISFPMVPFLEYAWVDFERKLVDELKASFHCCKAVVPGMIKRKSGYIVNVSSSLSRNPGQGFIAHSSAKSAIDAFTKSLALELGPSGICVNTVAPGLTLTDATAHLPDGVKNAVTGMTPLKRISTPEDVAGAILFYCCEMSGFVTGSYLPVSGGIQMS